MIDIMTDLRFHGYGGGSGTGKDKTPPPPVTGLAATSGNGNVILLWTNPIDTDFVGVRIVRKEGSYPTSPTDGLVVYSGANNSYTDNTVTNGTQYYYRAFTFDYDNNFNTTPSGQEATATPVAYIIYGVKIDTTNSNPSTAVTYIDDAVGFTPASGNNGAFNGGSWLDKFPFNKIKPCMFDQVNKTVYSYLNPNNYSLKEDGTTSILGYGTLPIMIEFSKVYWMFETVGSYIYIRISDIQIDYRYKCLAHMRGTVEKDKCYIGAYLGFNNNNILSSSSGITPTVSKTISDFRTSAKANGTGYDQMGYFQLLMLQILFVVMFKSLDSQTALGRGYVDGNASAIATGGTNAKGMYYGETTGKLQMKCFGIEDLWGNLKYFVDGIFVDSSYNLLIGTQSFNDIGNGYSNYGQCSTQGITGYINAIQGTTESGFISKTNTGSITTYYCDRGSYVANSLPYCGGNYAEGSNTGIFRLDINNGASYTNTSLCSRLMYL